MNHIGKLIILNDTELTPNQRRYWESQALAERLIARGVLVVDPFRQPIRELRKTLARINPHLKGEKLYRASTGGRWGKSSEIVTL